MANRPDYLYPLGSVNMHSPLELKQADMYGFFVKGDLSKLQENIDQTLNRVAADHARFQVISPYVMLTFTQVGHANSQVEVNKNQGWITELDIITWVMVGEMDGGKVNHIYFYPAHIFVDDAMALINGRELYGYPKYLCEYTMPTAGQDPTSFTLGAKGFKVFSPETKIAMNPLLSVTATNTGKPHTKIESLEQLIKQIIELLKAMPEAFNLDLQGIEDVLSLLVSPRTDQIFLKQFPDSAGEQAVYQAIVTAPAMVEKVRSVQLLGYDYQLSLEAFDSFPFNESLGWILGTQDAILPFHLEFDFTVTQGKELVNNSVVAPEKIAVLGGGVGSMTAAYWLTSQPGWQNKYDITVYQMGWRLGGKGASGRNANYGQRIEEHGLHIWFGFYENAFGMIKEVYDTLNRPDGSPLQKWTDAFKPQDFISLAQDFDGKWDPWNIVFPHKPGIPGDSAERISIWEMAQAAIAWIKQALGELQNHRDHPGKMFRAHQSWLEKIETFAKHVFGDAEFDSALAVEAVLEAMVGLEGKFEHHSAVSDSLKGLKRWTEQEFLNDLDQDPIARRLFTVIDLGLTTIIGMFEDGVFKNGFDTINNIDFKDWLIKHGGNPTYTANSAPVRGFYDLVFAYQDGDFSKPNAEAGTLLRAMMLIGVAYKGSIMYKMQAGMGDTIFSPIYQVLKARGVKFKFFQKVEEIVPSGDQISEIRMTQQVDVSSGATHYDPFVYVNGLACWPSVPNLDQIVGEQATLLKAANINLESNWSNWSEVYQAKFGKPLPQNILKKGVDFDRVIFGISIGALEQIAPKIVAANPALSTMVKSVGTVATQAYQVWFNKDLADLGWTYQPGGQQPVLSGFSEPFDTWAPMDQLLIREAWPAGNQQPKNVSYFCSALPVSSYPPISDYGFPKKTLELVKQGAMGQLENAIAGLLPNTSTAGKFNWDLLSDYSGAQGTARFDSQYVRANIDPSERYVLSLVGSTQHRVTAEQTGFSNLVFAGDWLKTGINAGCVEAAVMGGMQASRAISGFPKIIKGEADK